MGPLLPLLLLLGSFCHSLAALHERFADLPRANFDYIIVGGGNAGNVVANRLSEDPSVSVLLLEAGGSNRGAFLTEVPFYAPSLLGSKYDWGYSTVPQTGLNNRVLAYPRGFVLGGSSSINYMVYHRTSADDYNRYARVTGDQGWTWDNLQPYFRRNENFTAPVDHHNTSGQYNPAIHSTTGVVSVNLPGFPRGVDPLVINTAKTVEEFKFDLDMNAGNTLGVGWVQNTIKDGARSSSATAYLADKYLNRPNLHVLVSARVTKVVPLGSKSPAGPIFRGVEFTQDGGSSINRVTALREIILSAGSVNTPSILMHSGVGPKAALESLGIKTILDIRSVGQNLTEHPLAPISWRVNSTNTFEAFTRDPAAAAAAEARWNASHTGPLAATLTSQLGFFRLPKEIFKHRPDPASGPNTPHYELIFCGGLILAATPPTGNYFTIAIAAVQPTARGSITLSSNDPLAAPIINPNILGTEFDVITMREAFRAARRFIQSSSFTSREYIIDEFIPVDDTDEAIDAFLRAHTSLVFHPTGTAMMTAKDADFGVVNPDLTVKGAVGLRVVDGSIFPFIPAGHTQVPIYVIAERAADIIKAHHREQVEEAVAEYHDEL